MPASNRWVRFLQGATCLSLGEFVAARALLERVSAMLIQRAATSEPTFVGHYPEILAHLALTLAHLGYIDQARSRIDQALAEARRLGDDLPLVHVLVWRLGSTQITRSPMVHTGGISGSIDRARFRYFPVWRWYIAGGCSLRSGKQRKASRCSGRGGRNCVLPARRRYAGPFHLACRAHAMLGQQAEARTASPRLRGSSRPPRSGSVKPNCCIGCRAIC